MEAEAYCEKAGNERESSVGYKIRIEGI